MSGLDVSLLIVSSSQIIGLLDVFTPQCSLDEFTDVYMVTHLMGADLNNIIRTQRSDQRYSGDSILMTS